MLGVAGVISTNARIATETSQSTTPLASSIIELTPSSATFVDNRATTLGTWVIAGMIDCILMGIVFTQLANWVRTVFSRPAKQRMRIDVYLVSIVAFLSILKTVQAIGIIWQQNVMAFADPDRASQLVSKAWWQVGTTLLTGITGCTVQSFFTWRFYRLSRNWVITLVIAVFICLGFAGACLSTLYIVNEKTEAKVRWLLIHLVFVCIADLTITFSTVHTLYRRNNGLSSTASLIKKLLKVIFEAAIPPALFATIDLILTQTLGTKHLLWHILINYSLAKLYVISLLYTLNSVAEHHVEYTTDGKISFERRPSGRHGSTWLTTVDDIEMNPRFTDGTRISQLQLQTQLTQMSVPTIEFINLKPSESFPPTGESDSSWDRKDDFDSLGLGLTSLPPTGLGLTGMGIPLQMGVPPVPSIPPITVETRTRTIKRDNDLDHASS